jgi:hypothetical protein
MISFQPVPPISEAPVVEQLYVTVVGERIESTGWACFWLTIISGMFFIFPFFFMCCSWWQKKVFPKYEISSNFYLSLTRFARSSPNCRYLNIKVCDNAFTSDKARALFNGLQGSRLTAFSFTNVAGNFNYANNESDEFMTNANLLKQLPMTVTAKWGEMIMA